MQSSQFNTITHTTLPSYTTHTHTIKCNTVSTSSHKNKNTNSTQTLSLEKAALVICRKALLTFLSSLQATRLQLQMEAFQLLSESNTCMKTPAVTPKTEKLKPASYGPQRAAALFSASLSNGNVNNRTN